MFNNSKYTKWYFAIINIAKSENRKYDSSIHEKHHIIPKSLGGKNSKENIVILTFKEHFVCHLLLTKMCDSKKHKKSMLYAFYCLGNGFGHKRNYKSKNYARFKKLSIKIRSETMNGKNNPFYGKKHKKEVIDNLIKNNPAKQDNVKKKMSETRKRILQENPEKHSSFGRPHSEERKRKISDKIKGRKWINNGHILKMVSMAEIDSYLKDGWIHGKKLDIRNSF